MSSTSVIPSYMSVESPHDLPQSAYGLSPYHATTYGTVKLSPSPALPGSSSLSPTGTTTLSLLHSMGAGMDLAHHPVSNNVAQTTSTYFSNATGGMQNTGYFTPLTSFPNPDAYRFMQPHIHAALLHHHHHQYQPADHPGSPSPLVGQRVTPASTPTPQSSVASGACLLPGPATLGDGSPLYTNGMVCGKMNNGHNNGGMGDENGSGRGSHLPEHGIMMGNINPHTLTLIVRLLMSGKEAGSIIGKRGENVKKYREESGARINISDGSSPERIVTVTGMTDQISLAFKLMSQKFEDDFTQGLLRMGDEGLTCPPVTLRLLVHATQCGSIIGKGGSRIKDVRELTGASIQVASEALPTSTDRTVTISGTAKAIAKCIRHLCDIFIESPAKGLIIPYRPKPAMAIHPVVCPGQIPNAGILNPAMMLPACPSETGTENGFSINGPTVSCGSPTGLFMPNGASLNPSMETAMSTTTAMSSVASIVASQQGSSTSISSSGVNGTDTNGALMSDVMTDPMQLSTMSYPDYTNPQHSFLNNMSATHSLPGTMNNNLTMQLLQTVPVPDFTLNPTGMLNMYAPQQFPGFPNVFFAASPSDMLHKANCDDTTLSHNGLTNELLAKFDPSSPSPSVGGLSDSLLSLIQTNGYLPHGMGHPTWPQSLPTSPMHPMIPNRCSQLLGMPAFTMHPMLAGPVGGRMTPQMAPYGGHASAPHAMDEIVVREIIISNELIGCIIGRGGTTVNEIRNLSRAQIKISNCEDGAKERKITLSGPLHAVNLANFLINNSLLTHEQTRAFNVQLASAATALMTNAHINLPITENNRVGAVDATELYTSTSPHYDNQSNNSPLSTNASSLKIPGHVQSLKLHRAKCAPY